MLWNLQLISAKHPLLFLRLSASSVQHLVSSGRKKHPKPCPQREFLQRQFGCETVFNYVPKRRSPSIVTTRAHGRWGPGSGVRLQQAVEQLLQSCNSEPRVLPGPPSELLAKPRKLLDSHCGAGRRMERTHTRVQLPLFNS